jgi:hypothetical protein
MRADKIISDRARLAIFLTLIILAAISHLRKHQTKERYENYSDSITHCGI